MTVTVPALEAFETGITVRGVGAGGEAVPADWCSPSNGSLVWECRDPSGALPPLPPFCAAVHVNSGAGWTDDAGDAGAVVIAALCSAVEEEAASGGTLGEVVKPGMTVTGSDILGGLADPGID